MTNISMTHPRGIPAPSPRDRRGSHRAVPPPARTRLRRCLTARAWLTALLLGALAVVLLTAMGVIA